MDKNSRIFVAGHRGLVGSAIWKALESRGYTHLIGRTHRELDLEDPAAVREFFDREKPEYVFLAAAFVGGIVANSRYRADFIFRNLQIQQNVIGESFRHGVSKLLFLGSTCIYPREAPQPMKEDALLTSPLEYTNEPYAADLQKAKPQSLFAVRRMYQELVDLNPELKEARISPSQVRSYVAVISGACYTVSNFIAGRSASF